MIVLHAGWLDERLWLWAESPAAARPVRRPGRKARDAAPHVSPYDGGTEALAEALEQAGLPPLAAGRVIAWLPSVGARPLAGSPLVAEPPPDAAQAALAPWVVTAVALTSAHALDLLCACADRVTLAPGVIVGRDLAFWVAALRVSAALVTRQRFVPGVAARAGRHQAVWEPLAGGADADRLERLARAMPAAGRALALEPGAPPERPARDVLDAFVAALVDQLVRGAAPTPGPAVAPAPRARAARRVDPERFASLHEQWLQRLLAQNAQLDGRASELAAFAAQVRAWRRPLDLSEAAPFRLCLRLEEPAADGDDEAGGARARGAAGADWHLRYLMQAAHDPSLLVEARDVWRGRGTASRLLRRAGGDPREHLLASLGQAAGLAEPIARSLKAPAPEGCRLDTRGAFAFLSETAAALEQAGFGVLLPAWWTRKGTKLRLTLRGHAAAPAMQASAGLGLGELVNVNWELALGDEKLSLDELRALARLKAPLVRVRGQWVQLSAAEIEAALDFWRRRRGEPKTVREVVALALGAGETPGGLAFGGLRAEGVLADLVAQLEGHAAFEQLAPPAGFTGRLRPYQERGYSWLAFLKRWGLGACLADDMGLGKTVQALALLQRERERGETRPALLVCPTSVVGNWEKEAARFTPGLSLLVHHGVARAKGEAFRREAARHALVLSSYALLHRDAALLGAVDWAGVLLDEAQNVKNHATRQAQAARALRADYRVALSGTPVENNVGDLYSIMEFLNPSLLGSQAQFKRDFFVPIQAARDAAAAERLKRLTGPFILRRLKTDKAVIADLPDKLEMKVFCTLTREQASLYEAVVQEATQALAGAGGIQRKGVVLATLSKLKQVCNHPAQFLGDNSALPGRSGKLARLTEMLEEVLGSDERALVFSQFAEMGTLVKRHLQETLGHEVLFLHGGVAKAERDRLVARFQDDGGGARIFVLSLKAGGTGLNLTRASHVFHFDRWWNPAVENQATDRAFRIGQKRNVQVHKFLCLGTLEEKIDEMIERKQAVAESVVGSGEGWLTSLSDAELRQVFALRREAVAE